MTQTHEYTRLKPHLRAGRIREALDLTEKLLSKNQCAAHLHLMRGELLQLLDDGTRKDLRDAERAFKAALDLDHEYFDALVEMMHLYDCVLPNRRKAVHFAKRVKAMAQEVLKDAKSILAEGRGAAH